MPTHKSHKPKTTDELQHELAAAREEMAGLRKRVEELETALTEAHKARCPVCGDRLLRPADEVESI